MVVAESLIETEGSFIGFSLNLVKIKESQITEFYLQAPHKLTLHIRHASCVLHDDVLDIRARGIGSHGPEKAGEVAANFTGGTTSVCNCGCLPGKVGIIQNGFEVCILSKIGCELEPPVLECIKILLISYFLGG